MSSLKEQLKVAQKALNLSESLNIQSKPSYLRAIRASASETLDINFGRAIPIANKSELNRVISHAERKKRPFVVVASEDNNKTFVLLVDTKKSNKE